MRKKPIENMEDETNDNCVILYLWREIDRYLLFIFSIILPCLCVRCMQYDSNAIIGNEYTQIQFTVRGCKYGTVRARYLLLYPTYYNLTDKYSIKINAVHPWLFLITVFFFFVLSRFVRIKYMGFL